MSEPKETIGVKVPAAWKQQIKEICDELGISQSEWLYEAIGTALGKTNVNAVNSLPERVAALEKKLSRLAN